MAIDTALLTDYSWTQIKLAAKHAMMQAAVGGSQLSINGRMIGRISIKDAKALYDLATDQETAETAGETGGGNVLVNWGERY